MVVGIALTAAVLLLEIVLAGRWSEFYFSRGLPLFYRSTPCRPDASLDRIAESLSGEYADWLFPSIYFRPLGQHSIGFREGVFQVRLLNYTPVMRGYIEHDEGSGRVKVIGYAYAWPIVFIGMLMLRAESWQAYHVPAWPVALGLMGLYAGLYAIQFVRFNRIYHSVRQRVCDSTGA